MTRTNGVQHSGRRARRAALSQTVGVKEKSARNVRACKVRPRIICFWHWCTASRSTNFSRSRSSKRKISIDERKRDAAARLCSVWLRHHVFRGGITLDLVTTRVPQRARRHSFRLRNLPSADHPKKLWNCASRARQSQHWWNRVPVAGKQNWHQSWSHP